MTNTEAKPPLWKRKWFWGTIAGVFALGLVLNIVDPPEDADEASSSTSQESTPTPTEPVEAPEETEEAEPEPPSLAAEDVKAAWLEAHMIEAPIEIATREGGEMDPNNPIYAIIGWQDLNSTAIEVHVQEEIDRERADRVGLNIFNLVGPQFPDLQTVLIRGVSQEPFNFYRSNAPLADG